MENVAHAHAEMAHEGSNIAPINQITIKKALQKLTIGRVIRANMYK